MKTVRAVAPYFYIGKCNFKHSLYNAWKNMGGKITASHYPWRILHSLVYKYELPRLPEHKKEARLRFVSGFSIQFDTFPDYVKFEIIPIIWDCWPAQVKKVAKFMCKYNVKTAIFTSSQMADKFRNLFPQMNVLTITEGVDMALYSKGKVLAERSIDILEVGRGWTNFFNTSLPKGIRHIKTGNFSRVFKTDEEFRQALADTKITINVPRCDVDKENAGDIETLTQRYWECMLSRVIMVGRAPKELTELIGYNPVIDWNGKDATPLVTEILSDIDRYQELVDKNYTTALRMSSWDIRVKQIMDYLTEKEYLI